MTLYDAIGGEASVTAAVDDFYARVLADPELSGFFGATALPRLKAHQRAFITLALGGPPAYQGRSMTEAHSGLGIADQHFDKVVGHLGDTLAALGVPVGTIAEITTVLGPLRTEIVS